MASNANTFSGHILFFGKGLDAELFAPDKLELTREDILTGELDTYLFNEHKRYLIKLPNTNLSLDMEKDSMAFRCPIDIDKRIFRRKGTRENNFQN